MKIGQDWWDGIFRNLDAGGGGAAGGAAGADGAGSPPAGGEGGDKGAAAGGDGKPANLAALARQEAGGAPPPGDGKAQEGEKPKSYFPEGLNPEWQGASERETLDRIAKELSSRPKAPDKPEGYDPKFKEDFTKRYGDLKGDPVFEKLKPVFHKLGLANEAVADIVETTHAALAEAGLVDDPVHLGKELEKLMPASGDPMHRKSQAAARVNAAADWVDGLAARGALSKDQAAKLSGLTMDALGVETLEVLMKMGREHGLQPGGEGARGGDTKDTVLKLMQDPRYDLRGPKGDAKFVAEVDARWRKLHGVA